MKPLIVLLAVFVLALAGTFMFAGRLNPALSAQIAMAVMLAFTAMGHFAFTNGMAMMIPAFIPFKKPLVYITGFMEIAAAVCLLVPSVRNTTAWLLIAFFVVMLPATINAALKHIDYEKGTNNGSGPAYLWFRVPLQVLFIAWVYVSCLMG